jgi:hypothetical protein
VEIKLNWYNLVKSYPAINQQTIMSNWNFSHTEELQAEIKKLKEELAALRDTERHIIIPAYWFIDEETGEKVYDTDEMESEFHDALVDLGAYNDELRCEGCDKRFGKTESSFQNAEGLAVCADCFKAEESGEE